MKKTYSYKDCYQILDIEPSCNWKELRRAYKTSIQKWHPDRFEDDSNEKSAAENKIKTINIAYTQINQYYRDNKILPPIMGESPTVNTTITSHKTSPKKSHKQARQAPKKPVPQSIAKTSRFPLFTSIILLTGGFSLYLIFQPETNTGSPQNDSHYTNMLNEAFIENTQQQAPEKIQQHHNPSISSTSYFTVGSTIGDVINAQGLPTRTAGNIWFYGKSEIHFSHGEVTHWVRSSNNPLRIQLKNNPYVIKNNH